MARKKIPPWVARAKPMRSTHQNMPLTPATIEPHATAGEITCGCCEIRKRQKIAENLWKLQIKSALNDTFVGFWACMDRIFHSRQFGTLWECVWLLSHTREAGKNCNFLPHFSPFFTHWSTFKSYNNPLKVIFEGLMVEYLPVGS